MLTHQETVKIGLTKRPRQWGVVALACLASQTILITFGIQVLAANLFMGACFALAVYMALATPWYEVTRRPGSNEIVFVRKSFLKSRSCRLNISDLEATYTKETASANANELVRHTLTLTTASEGKFNFEETLPINSNSAFAIQAGLLQHVIGIPVQVAGTVTNLPLP